MGNASAKKSKPTHKSNNSRSNSDSNSKSQGRSAVEEFRAVTHRGLTVSSLHEHSGSASEAHPYGHEVHNRPAIPDPDEEERLQKLLSYEILDTERESVFDDMVLLASTICGTPMAAITLIDASRQWFKAKFGIDGDQTPRETAFCTHTIKGKELLVVENALLDQRFANNEHVLGEPNVRFYAGAPLMSDDGYALGAICAFDSKPRMDLTPVQKGCLQAISRQIMTLLEARSKLREFKTVVADLRATEAALLVAKEAAEAANVSSVEHLILSTDGFDAFRTHLREEFSEENLLFFQACKEFRLHYSRGLAHAQAQLELIHEDARSPRSGGDAALTQATNEMDTQLVFQNKVKLQTQACYHILSIYLVYISDGSPREVNLPSTTRGDLLAVIEPLTAICQTSTIDPNHLRELSVLPSLSLPKSEVRHARGMSALPPTFSALQISTDPTSEHEITEIPQNVLEELAPRQAVEEVVRSGKFTPTEEVFEAAQYDILKLLKEDSYRRFKASSHYTTLLKKVGEMGKQRLKESQHVASPQSSHHVASMSPAANSKERG